MLPLFPRGVLDETLNLIESVSEGFPSYFWYRRNANFNNFENINVSSAFHVNKPSVKMNVSSVIPNKILINTVSSFYLVVNDYLLCD